MFNVFGLSLKQFKEKNYVAAFSAKVSLFSDPVWFTLLDEHVIKDTGEVVYFVVEKNERPVFLMPLIIKPFGLLKRYKVAESLTTYYSTFYEPIYLGNEEDLPGALDSLFKYLRNNRVLYIKAYGFLSESSLLRSIGNAAISSNFTVDRFDCYGNWYLKVSSSDYDSYYNSRPSQLKNTIKRRSKKILKDFDSVEYVLVSDNSVDIEKYIADYEKIYAKSWKIDEPYKEFIRNIIRYHAGNGSLRMGLAYLNHTVAAAQIWFYIDSVSYIFKLAYDPDYRDTSVGTLLTDYLFRHSISIDNATKIDYLTGDDPYKKDWVDIRDQVVGVELFNTYSIMGKLLVVFNTAKPD